MKPSHDRTTSEDESVIDMILPTPWRINLKPSDPANRVLEWFDRSFYLDLGHVCNQNCRYCWQDKSEARFSDTKSLFAQIDLALRLGLTKPILIGGEPLLHPELEALIKRLQERGFRRWGIMSNGLRLADEKEVNHLVESGLSYCQLSIDSPSAKTQAALSNNPELPEILQLAAANLAKHAQLSVDVNAVLTAENGEEVPGLVSMLDRWRSDLKLACVLAVTQLKASPRIEDGLLVSAEEAGRLIGRTLEEGKRLSLPVFFRNLPFCMLADKARYSADLLCRIVRVDASGNLQDTRRSPEDGTPACRSCIHRLSCPGLSSAYLERYPECSVQPVPRDDKEALAIYSADPTEDENLDSWWSSLLPIEKLIREPDERSKLNLPADRLAIGCIGDDGEARFFDLPSVLANLPDSGKGSPLVLCAAEASLHPELPAIVGAIASKNHEVWLETTALAMTDARRVKLLASWGLHGIIWIHFNKDNPIYYKILGSRLNQSLESKISRTLRDSKLPIEHHFLLVDEKAEALGERIKPWMDGGLEPVLSTRPYSDSAWAGWLGDTLPSRELLLEQIEYLQMRWGKSRFRLDPPDFI